MVLQLNTRKLIQVECHLLPGQYMYFWYLFSVELLPVNKSTDATTEFCRGRAIAELALKNYRWPPQMAPQKYV